MSVSPILSTLWCFPLILIVSPVLGLVGTHQAQSDTCGYLDESLQSGDIRATAPWTASIYHRANARSPFKFLINGAIIGPTTVLTIFGGVYGVQLRGSKKDYSLPAPENSLVTAGFLSNNLKSKDAHSQTARVEYILPYRGHGTHNQQYHFIIYRLSTPLNLNTSYVRGICLPYFTQRPNRAPSDDTFFNAGYINTINRNVSFARLPMTRQAASICRSTFTYHYKTNDSHVFCAVHDSNAIRSSSAPSTCLAHGSLAVKNIKGRWYLQGLLVLIPGKRRGICNERTVYFYGKVLGHVEWLGYNVRCKPKEFPCYKTGVCKPLHAVCNSIEECFDSSDEDAIFCAATAQQRCINQFSCGIRGKCIALERVCNEEQDCPDGADESARLCANKTAILAPPTTPVTPTTPPSREMCFPLAIAEGVALSCKDSATLESIDCSLARAGTTATLTCLPYYSSKGREASIQMTCGQDGLWNPFKPFACEANCGIISTDVKGFLYGGEAATRSNAFPWHASLFVLDQTEYKYICGASLIEKKVLITSAHCLLDPLLSPTSKLHAVLAPASSEYEENLEDQLAKIFEVVQFWTHPSYNPKNFAADLALLQVNDSITYNQFVRPVCYLPRQNVDSNLVNRSGKIAGFDLNDGTNSPSELKFVTIPVVPNELCANNQEIPRNSFCAGSPNVSGLCRGDSGGGLVFSEKKTINSGTRYILKGVASATASSSSSEPCVTDHYSFFTDVEKYANWIYTVLESIDVDV